MAKETFQQISSEIIKKAKDGTLTIGEAIDFTLDPRVPLTEDYSVKNAKGEFPARNRVQTLKNSLKFLQKRAPDSFPLGADTPLKDMRQPEITFLFRRDGSPDMSSRAYNYQTFENIFFNALKGKRIERFFEVVDGNEEDMYPRLAGTGNPMGTQRTGLAGERPMQGTLPKAELDTIYAEALPEISTNYGDNTARLAEYHRLTFQRPEQLLNLKTSDVVIKGDTITVKGKVTTEKDHKGRPELRYKSNSPMGELLIAALNDESIPMSGNDRSLFGVDEDTFNAAFNNHVGTRLEKFADVLPLADVKVEEGGKVVRIDQKPVTTPSAIRSIVPHYMLKDMKVNRDIVQGLMGHKPNDELANNYAGVIVNEELPNVLQNPEAFAETGFATTKGGKVGLEVDLLDEDQRAKLADEYLETQSAELEARKATAGATTAEMGLRQQAATVERAAGMPEEIAAETTIAEGKAQIEQVQSEARKTARVEADAKKGGDLRGMLRGILNKDTLQSAAFAGPLIAEALSKIPMVGGAAELGFNLFERSQQPPLPEGEGPFLVSDTDSYSLATQYGAAQAERLGLPPAVGKLAGATAEFFTGAPSAIMERRGKDIEYVEPSMLREARQSREARESRDEFGNLDPDTGLPPQPRGSMLEAGDASSKVREARGRALRGETTSMLDVQPQTL